MKNDQDSFDEFTVQVINSTIQKLEKTYPSDHPSVPVGGSSHHSQCANCHKTGTQISIDRLNGSQGHSVSCVWIKGRLKIESLRSSLPDHRSS